MLVVRNATMVHVALVGRCWLGAARPRESHGPAPKGGLRYDGSRRGVDSKPSTGG